ncbi:glycoside hydrolase, partial [Gymnopus androsaceus JB14]
CSYNRVNDTHACNNAKSLNGLLKTELNFPGSIMSDWGAQWNNLLSAEMTWTYLVYNLITFVENGSLSEDNLREKDVRNLTPYYYLGQDVNPPPPFL